LIRDSEICLKLVTGVEGDRISCLHFPSNAPIGDDVGVADAYGPKRKTVSIKIAGLVYEVGPEVHLAAGIFTARQMHDGYCETPEYLALVRGALHFMEVEHIDLLILGLPVATLKAKRPFLEKRMAGKHDVGKGRSVVVDQVRVLAQPQGALLYYGAVQGRVAELRNERNLVIDTGARTFDWVLSQGFRLIGKKSHSVNRGMADVLGVIADKISNACQTQFRDFDRIDQALRTGRSPKVFGKPYDVSKHVNAARKIAEDAVAEMMRYVGDGSEIDNILLVGGGAFFFRPVIAEAFPQHPIHEVGEGLYANVRGFQLAGQELIKTYAARSVQGAVSPAATTEA
jgi:plasmid segregation protein ParM